MCIRDRPYDVFGCVFMDTSQGTPSTWHLPKVIMCKTCWVFRAYGSQWLGEVPHQVKSQLKVEDASLNHDDSDCQLVMMEPVSSLETPQKQAEEGLAQPPVTSGLSVAEMMERAKKVRFLV